MTIKEFIEQHIKDREEERFTLLSDYKGKIIYEICFEGTNINIYFTDMTYLEIYIENGIYTGNIEGIYDDTIFDKT